MPKKRENGEGGICYEKDRDKYRAYIYDPEGNRLRERFDTREEAQNWLDELKAQFQRNEYVVPNNITLSQWIIRWLKTYKTEICDTAFSRPISGTTGKRYLPVLLWNINALKHGGTPTQHSCLPKVYRCWKYVNASGTSSRHIPLICTATPSQILIKTLRLKLQRFTALQYNKIKLSWCRRTSFFNYSHIVPSTR